MGTLMPLLLLHLISTMGGGEACNGHPITSLLSLLALCHLLAWHSSCSDASHQVAQSCPPQPVAAPWVAESILPGGAWGGRDDHSPRASSQDQALQALSEEFP